MCAVIFYMDNCFLISWAKKTCKLWNQEMNGNNWHCDSIESFSNREQNTDVFERRVHDTSERISSFNICETARTSQPTSGKEGWKVEKYFFSPLPLNHGAFTPLPVVSWGLGKTLPETNTHPPRGVYSWMRLVFILLINSGKTPGSEAQLQIF